MLDFPEQMGADTVDVGVFGRPEKVPRVRRAAAVNPDMIDENGEYCCVHTCIQCCVETEVEIDSPLTLAHI